MDFISVKDARRQFARLVGSAGRGCPVTITRRGRAIAQIAPIESSRRPLPDLSAFRASLGKPVAKSAATIRHLRQENRY
jgi:prevent-host-death family protein